MKSSALAAGVRQLRDKMAVLERRDDSDEQLLHAFTAQRDHSAFAALVRRYGPLVQGVCRRVLHHAQDAEDAFHATFKIAAVLVMAATLLGGAGWGFLSAARQPTTPDAAHGVDIPRSAKNEPAKNEPAKTEQIHGRVLALDGTPKAGAKLQLLNKEGELKQLGESGADGRFSIAIPKRLKRKDRGWETLWPALLAQAEGAGVDYLSLDRHQPDHPLELRLTNDHPIRGRIVNTEGKPIAGVRVGVRSIDTYANNSLDSFLVAWKKRPFNQGPLTGEKLLWFRATSPLTAISNADGRFILSGVGTERFVKLDLQGAGIAEAHLFIINRAGFDPKPYNQASLDNIPKGRERLALRMMLHGPDVTVVAEPEKVIRGTIQDADSGKELPNVIVHLEPSDDAAERRASRIQTDARGRYEFHGIPRAKAYRLVSESDPIRGYLASQVRLANNAAGYSPLTADLRLKKGVIVSGKAIDRATGKFVPGGAKVCILADNPFAKDYQRFGFSDSAEDHYKYRADTDAHGVFRVVTIPGPVVVMGRSGESRTTGNFLDDLKYTLPIPDPKYPQYFSKSPDGVWTYYNRFGGGQGGVDGNFCKVLDIEPGLAVVHQDIVLERASALEVKIQDAGGRPVSGVWAADFASTPFTEPLWVEGPCCPVYSLEVRKPRRLVFYEPKQKLVGSLALKGDETAPLVVRLRSTGAIEGRLLDGDGKPLAGVVVDASYPHYAAQQIHQMLHEAKQAVTDATGAFALDDLIPELKFELSFRLGKRRFERETRPADPAIQLKPGECRDIGTLKLKRVGDAK